MAPDREQPPDQAHRRPQQGAEHDRLVEPLLGGVYAGRADELSLQATMPALAAHLPRAGSVLGRPGALVTCPVEAGVVCDVPLDRAEEPLRRSSVTPGMRRTLPARDAVSRSAPAPCWPARATRSSSSR